MLSLFTPTHDTQYLAETYRSVAAQNFTDFEWIIVPNAKVGEPLPVIPDAVKADSRVKIIPLFWEDKPRIGQLKRFACDNSKGSTLIELDHDDLLVPLSLQRIAECEADGGDFIYSDTASFLDDANKTPWGYDRRWGWETYDFQVYNRICRATRNFEISPRSLCEIYFAPDHVRCWRRETYFKAGGHDVELVVGDDHDLVCRTYLSGAEFLHTGTCNYLYRHHSQNTVKTHNGQIQKQQNANRDKYFHKLVDQWLVRTGLHFLDLAKKPILYESGKLRLSAADNSVGCVRAWNGILPSIPRGQETAFMNEVYRVLAPGGYFCAFFPSTDGREAFAPQYNSFWNEHTFDYYTQADYARKLPNVNCRFQRIRSNTLATTGERKKSKLLDTYIDLLALKGQRVPGRTFI